MTIFIFEKKTNFQCKQEISSTPDNFLKTTRNHYSRKHPAVSSDLWGALHKRFYKNYELMHTHLFMVRPRGRPTGAFPSWTPVVVGAVGAMAGWWKGMWRSPLQNTKVLSSATINIESHLYIYQRLTLVFYIFNCMDDTGLCHYSLLKYMWK